MILREYSERHNMRIEEIPNVQLVLSRIQEIENRFVKEAPTQSKEQTKNSFDSILKSEQGKSISSLEKEKNFGKDLKNIEPSLAKIIHQESEKTILILDWFRALSKQNLILKQMQFLPKVQLV